MAVASWLPESSFSFRLHLLGQLTNKLWLRTSDVDIDANERPHQLRWVVDIKYLGFLFGRCDEWEILVSAARIRGDPSNGDRLHWIQNQIIIYFKWIAQPLISKPVVPIECGTQTYTENLCLLGVFLPPFFCSIFCRFDNSHCSRIN